MFNHFMMFEDESAARSALPDFCAADRAGHLVWDASRVIANQRVVLARAVYVMTNQTRFVETSPEIIVPGWFITVTLPDLNEALRDLPNYACRLIGSAETCVILYTAPDVDAGMLATAIIEPMPAGARYTMGVSA